jgi:hypothetical protein
METIFLVCAVSGGIVLILQFLAGSLGLLGDHDFEHEHGHGLGDSDHLDHDHGGANWFAGLLNLRTITAGLTFFGLGGMTALYAQIDEMLSLVIAGFTGFLALFIVAQVMKGIKRLKSDGSARIERCIGTEAVVYLQIPGKNTGPGKITVTFQKRTMEYAAYTQAENTLRTGSKVRVVAVRGPSTVDVEPV